MQKHNNVTEEFAQDLIDAGLLETDLAEIENQLGSRIQQELLQASAGGADIPNWAQGDFGTKDLARRFINSQFMAIKEKLCEEQSSQLKPQYTDLVEPTLSKAASIAGLANIILEMLNVKAPHIAIPSIASYFALWLIHFNLNKLCSQKVITDIS